MLLHQRSCANCGSTDTSNIYAQSNYDENLLNAFSFASRKTPELMHYRLISCTTCDLLYASPAPKTEFLQQAYEEAEYDSGQEAQFASTTYIHYLKAHLKNLPDLKNALDIGAGDGAFLERLLEQGFSGIEGIEPSTAPIKFAKKNIQALLKQGFFEAKNYPRDHYSLVSCFQTLEHLEEPKTVCSAALELLKPGGAFFTVSHNYRAFSAKVLGKKSPIFDIEHLQLFSPKSMQHLLENIGFEKVIIFSIANRYPLRYWLKLLPFNAKIKDFLIRFMDTVGLGSLAIPMPAGNMAAIGFKPINSKKTNLNRENTI